MTDDRIYTAEMSVIGCAMLWPLCLDMAVSQLSDKDFLHEGCREIFAAAAGLMYKGKPAEPATIIPLVSPELKALIIEATSTVISSSSAQHYIDAIKDASRRRALLECLIQVQSNLMFGCDISEAESALSSVIDNGPSPEGYIVDGCQAMSATLQDLEKTRRDGKPVGITTGINDLDRTAGRFNPSGYYIIGARSGMGKTALMLCMARAAAISGKRVLIFSLEMPSKGPDGLGSRLLSIESSINMSFIRASKYTNLDYELLLQQSKEPYMQNLTICDKAELTVMQIRSIIRRVKPDIVFLDYIGLIKPIKADSRRVEVDNISHDLRATAKIFNIPLVTLVQLNRDVEKESDKRPKAKDIREADAIFHDADMVAFLYRESEYREHADNETAELIIAKNRQGKKGSIPLAWFGEIMTFSGMLLNGDRPSRPVKPEMKPIPNDVEFIL